MKKLIVLLGSLAFCAPAWADSCVSVDRAKWPEKYQKASVAGAVSMIAADDGIDPFLPGVPGSRVEQRGFGEVCVVNPNPAFDFSKVTSSALLQKMRDNDDLQVQAEADVQSEWSALSVDEKLERLQKGMK